MISPNIKKYEIIWQAKQNDPTVVLSTLCDKYKVSYQSYNNWVKRHKKSAPKASSVPASKSNGPSSSGQSKKSIKELVTVLIPLTEIVNAIRFKRAITIPRDRLLNALPADILQKVKDAVWALTMEQGSATHSDGLATDDGELSPGKINPFDAKAE